MLILNALNKTSEAENQIQQLIAMHEEKPSDHSIFAKLYIQQALIAFKKSNRAKANEYLNKALSILELDNKNINSYYLDHEDIALGYVIKADILIQDKNIQGAINYYLKAFNIYNNLYGKNKAQVAQMSDLYIKGAKAACDIEDHYHYSIFGQLQIQDFGLQNTNTKEMLGYCNIRNMQIQEQVLLPKN